MIVWRRRSTGRARILHLLGAIAVLAGAGPLAHAQEPVDSSLLAYIATIRAIDVHAHPMRPVPPGAPADTEFDALPLDGIPPFAVPHRLSLDDPVWRSAQTALFHAPEAPNDSVYRASLRTRVESARREHGERFPEWTLDAAGIDVMLANRIAMGPGLSAPRFRWVPFALSAARDAARSEPDARHARPLPKRGGAPPTLSSRAPRRQASHLARCVHEHSR